MNRIFRIIIGSGVAAFFIWLALKNINTRELIESIRQTEISYIVMAILVFFAGYSCRIERWRLMLINENAKLNWTECAGPLMASVAANNVLPLRAGDIFRAIKFNKQLRISATTSITTLFVERLLDLLMIVLFLGVALAYFGMDSSRLIGIGGGALLSGGAIILFLLIFPSIFKPFAYWLSKAISRAFPKFGQKLDAEFTKIFTALEHTSKGSTMIKLICWSFVAWLSEGLVFWLIALSIPTISYDLAAWLALPVGTLATIIPSTPGYVGTFDYFTGQAMIALGNGDESSIAFAFIVHAVLWLPPTVVGGLYFLIIPSKKTK